MLDPFPPLHDQASRRSLEEAISVLQERHRNLPPGDPERFELAELMRLLQRASHSQTS
jgi:hypothetical protein